MQRNVTPSSSCAAKRVRDATRLTLSEGLETFLIEAPPQICCGSPLLCFYSHPFSSVISVDHEIKDFRHTRQVTRALLWASRLLVLNRTTGYNIEKVHSLKSNVR